MFQLLRTVSCDKLTSFPNMINMIPLNPQVVHFIVFLFVNEAVHEIIVLITEASSEGSGEHAQSLARAFAFRTDAVLK